MFGSVCAGAGVGKTQLVKGKLACLPEEMMSLNISFNYFTDVVSFQKVCQHSIKCPINMQLHKVEKPPAASILQPTVNAITCKLLLKCPQQ
jgi:hypothetical protein